MNTETSSQEDYEYKLLCDNQINRLETYKLYKYFIDNLENGNKQKWEII